MKRFGKILARILVAAFLVQLLPGGLLAFAASTKELKDDSFNGEGLWITEIYNNDVDRSEKNNTRESDGYLSIPMYASASDLMEYVEVCNTHDDPIKLNELYEISLDGVVMPVTDMAGSSDITLTKSQVAVLWNYRTDIVMPTEEQLRAALRIPDEAVVLKLSYGSNWPAAGGTFAVKNKVTGETISAFTAEKDTHTLDGYAVELKVPVFKSSAMEVHRALILPTPGRVYTQQVNGMIQAMTPSDFDGKGLYLTEIRPNDVNRSSTYGTSTDLMECFEIVNTTDQEVTLNEDYQIVYTVKEGYRKALTIRKYSSSASDHLGSTSGCTIPAGGTAVIWNYRQSYISDATSFPTLSKFRSAYGISSDTPVYIFADQNGLNNLNRSLEIFTLDSAGGLDKLISAYTWLGDADCKNDTSAQLQINPEGPAMLLSGASATTTMGSVDTAQLEFVLDDGSAMELRLYDGSFVPDYLMQGEDLRVWFYNKSQGLSKTGCVSYYRLDGEGDWTLTTEGGSRVPYRYEVVISGGELFDHDYVEFYVVASNYYRDTYRGVYRVDIKNLNDVEGVRTNISQGEELSGTVAITANDGSATNSATQIYIDGVKQTVKPVLEDGAYLSYTATGIDTNTYSALTTNKDQVIHNISKWAYQCPAQQVKYIDGSYFSYKSSTDTYNVTLRFWAGTGGTPTTDTMFPTAPRDDWELSQVKMKLANGNEYLPTKVGPSTYNGVDVSTKVNTSTALSAVHQIGDSTGKSPYVAVTFAIPASEVTAVGVDLDTTTMTDGEHTLKVTNGTDTKDVTFIVDNTAPAIDMGVLEGDSLTGLITLNPWVDDANNVDEFVTTLDGNVIALPYETTAFSLGEGNHTLSVYAVDGAGNTATETVNFTVDDISMIVTDGGTTDITSGNAKLYLTAQSDSATNVTFYRAEKIAAGNIKTTVSDGILPHIQYTLAATDAAPGDTLVVSWDGAASNADDTHALNMFVRNVDTGAWDLVAAADENGAILNVSIPVEGHIYDGLVNVLIQCTADSALPDVDTSNDGITGNNAGWTGSQAPTDYDFAFAWITDTQYYVQKYNKRFIHMNNWIVDNAESWKIKYVLHTGDIVDDWNAVFEWENADTAMKIFDDAGMPYGVLPGNHDVASGCNIREYYYTYFSAERVQDQPTYGGSYLNNYGHYDLISENGQDFIIVYMGWGVYEDEVNWMNQVLAQHSDRKAILCFHGYTHMRESVDGLLDYTGVMVRDQVVAKNPNVFAVLNGHYSGSTYQTVRFDDNGDGKKDRTVYQICTDYQSLDQGGMEYIKFLYFDLDNDKVFVNAYSPLYDDFNYYDATSADDLNALAKADSDGVVYKTDVDALTLDVNFDTGAQTILENSFSACLYTDEVLAEGSVNAATGRVDAVASGLSAQTEYMWYAVLENENTGYLRTETYSFTTEQAPTPPTISLAYPTLLLEDVIKMNVYFTLDQDIELSKLGMLTWTSVPSTVDISTADAVIPGATYYSDLGYYGVTTEAIPAQNLGDVVYFCIYAELDDGTYAYGKQVSYSPTTYAYNQLKAASTTDAAKSLYVAILNYGAAAQTYLGYNTDALINASLTDTMKAYVEEYNSSMVHSVSAVSATKQGSLASNGGFSAKKPSISLDGAFAINYYFTPSAEVSGDMTFYYWNAADFAAVDVLSIDNATGSAAMTADSGVYGAAIEGIAAKDIDSALYACGVYTDANGNTYSTGILPYSLGVYCGNQAVNGTEKVQPLAAAIAVYGYYAANFFAGN